jgi:coenzyme F420-reducing hydrogenase delta subunit
LLSYAGIHPDRLLLEWVSASEGGRFAEVVDAFTQQVKALGPLETKQEDATRAEKVA